MRHAGAARLPPPAAVVLAGTLVLATVLAVAPSIPTTRDGVDSTNFGLAVDRYALAQHQPHPPGYPVEVAMGRLVTAAYRRLSAAETDLTLGTAVAGLRIWSLFCGLCAIFAVRRLAFEIGVPSSRAWVAAVVFAACPLVLITSLRPLSDAPGLLFALGSQVLALVAYSRRTRIASEMEARGRRDAAWPILAAAALSGLAVGVRVQTALLTIPVMALVVLDRPTRPRGTMALWVTGAFIGGALIWAVPMLIIVGPTEYLRLLAVVADDDIRGVEMLATTPSAHVLKAAIINTFVLPWGWAPAGWVALGLAGVGAFSLLRQERRRFVAVMAIALPYIAFHMAFQETASVRYALPVMMVEACLVAAAVGAARWVVPTLLALVVAGAAVSARVATAYWQVHSPVANAIDELMHDASGMESAPALALHHAVERAARGTPWPGDVLDAPVRYEWLKLADYWLSGGSGKVWFLGDSRRTDLALIDPRSRRLVRSYRWPDSVEPLLGGIQPPRVDWHEVRDPGWLLLRGWSLTPETHGVSRRDGHMPGRRGVEGRIRRRGTPALMMIGGRNLGGPCDTGAIMDVSIDGRSVAQWTAASQSPFLQVVPLAPGDLEGAGPFATLLVTARDTVGTARMVDVAIETFDLQSPGTTMAAFGQGWHVPELDSKTGELWRWMDETGELQVEGFGKDVELTIRGASPADYFRTVPRVEIRAGDAVLATLQPTTAYSWVVRIPAAALAASGGRLTLRSDRWFIPDEVDGNGDRRRLSMQVFEVASRPVS